MLTILSSPVSPGLLAKLLASAIILGVLVTGCGTRQEIQKAPEAIDVRQAPDSPLPALEPVRDIPPTVDSSQLRKPVELKSVTVEVLRPDSEFAKLPGPDFWESSKFPFVIHVDTIEPIDPTPRTSSPVIVLNGVQMADTWVGVGRANQLVAFLADSELLKERNSVAVVWLGNEEQTRTLEPLTFLFKDIVQ